jgi:hypothetical protein
LPFTRFRVNSLIVDARRVDGHRARAGWSPRVDRGNRCAPPAGARSRRGRRRSARSTHRPRPGTFKLCSGRWPPPEPIHRFQAFRPISTTISTVGLSFSDAVLLPNKQESATKCD